MQPDPFSSVPPKIAHDMRRTARRHLPSQSWDAAADPGYAARARARGRAAALRALRYGFPAWTFEVRAGHLIVTWSPDAARSSAPARMVAP